MPLLRTIKLEVLTPRFFLLSLLFSFLYIFLFVFVPNNKLLLYSFVNFPIHTTFNLFTSLVVGLPKSVSNIDLLLLLVTAGLVGVNISLILKTLKRLKNQKVRISVGGGTILAIVATGCSACGLSIISLFGLTAATFAFLPFRGMELNLFAISVLLLSFVYTLRKLNEVCEIKY